MQMKSLIRNRGPLRKATVCRRIQNIPVEARSRIAQDQDRSRIGSRIAEGYESVLSCEIL